MSQNTAQFPAAIWDGSSPARPAPIANIDRAPVFEDWDQITAEVQAMQTKANENDLVVPNAHGAAVVVGRPVYLKANASGAEYAAANGTAPARNLLGLVMVGAAGSGGNVTVRQRGDLSLTTAQWDAVAGTTGGLAANTEYYLSDTAGSITATVPATTGDTDIVVGVAKSATVLNVAPRFILSSHA